MYLEKLTREDIEELEKVVMGCDSFDRKQTQIHIDSNQNLYVTFWEEIPPDDDEPEQEKCYAETRYVYYDFEPPAGIMLSYCRKEKQEWLHQMILTMGLK